MSTTLKVDRAPRIYGKRRNILREIAAQRNRSPGGLAVDCYGEFGAFGRTASILEDLVRFGAVELAQRQVTRFIRIVANQPPKPLTPTLLLESARADAAEDVARTALQCALSDTDPTNDEPARRDFARKARHAIAELTMLVEAVESGLPK